MRFRTPLAVAAAAVLAVALSPVATASAAPSPVWSCVKGTTYRPVISPAYCKTGETRTLKGEKGDKGDPGKDGASAYQLAKRTGFNGNLAAWLLSLHGKDGVNGVNGINGTDGKDGNDGKDGASFPTTFKLDFHQDGTYSCTWVQATSTFDCPKV